MPRQPRRETDASKSPKRAPDSSPSAPAAIHRKPVSGFWRVDALPPLPWASARGNAGGPALESSVKIRQTRTSSPGKRTHRKDGRLEACSSGNEPITRSEPVAALPVLPSSCESVRVVVYSFAATSSTVCTEAALFLSMPFSSSVSSSSTIFSTPLPPITTGTPRNMSL